MRSSVPVSCTRLQLTNSRWSLFHMVFISPSWFSGMFPNHIPNPEDKIAMKSVTQAVLQNKADLGIIFDTDVDRLSYYTFSNALGSSSILFTLFFLFYRSAAVDSTGREFNRNRLIALISAIILEEVSVNVNSLHCLLSRFGLPISGNENSFVCAVANSIQEQQL